MANAGLEKADDFLERDVSCTLYVLVLYICHTPHQYYHLSVTLESYRDLDLSNHHARAAEIRFLEAADRSLTPIIKSGEEFENIYVKGEQSRSILGHTNADSGRFGDMRRQGTLTLKETPYRVVRKSDDITKSFVLPL